MTGGGRHWPSPVAAELKGQNMNDQEREFIERAKEELDATEISDIEQEPVPTEPQAEDIEVECAGCGRRYQFNLVNASAFKFECKVCKTVTQWSKDDVG